MSHKSAVSELDIYELDIVESKSYSKLFSKRPMINSPPFTFNKIKRYILLFLPYIISILFFSMFLSKNIQYNLISDKYTELNQKVLDQIFAPYHSDILSSLSQLSHLKRMIRSSIGVEKHVTMRLVYKATVHGDKAKEFHKSISDHKGYLIIINDDDNNLFGGFTSKSFKSLQLVGFTVSNEFEDKYAFLFSLSQNEIYQNVKGKITIQGDDDFGPVFGEEDLIIKDEFMSKESYSKFPGSYTMEGKDKEEIQFRLTGGKETFLVKEMEMYEVYW